MLAPTYGEEYGTRVPLVLQLWGAGGPIFWAAVFLGGGGRSGSKIYGYLVPTERSGPCAILPAVAFTNRPCLVVVGVVAQVCGCACSPARWKLAHARNTS